MTQVEPSTAATPPRPRDELLAAVIGYAARRGIADVSLRQLAAQLGTSHRMLIYHFGSKEGLLAAVVGEVERRQREAVGELRRQPGMTPVAIAEQMWRRFADPELWPLERLFFELYAQALQGREHTGDFLRAALDPWLDLFTEVHTTLGVPAGEARALARLGIATTRGLLLDLLATGDRDGVDDAARLFATWYEQALRQSLGSLTDRLELDRQANA
ncbi:MAG TPA: TetR/AcrR family transcriptional regulator [Micromonosporaceae bacterium]